MFSKKFIRNAAWVLVFAAFIAAVLIVTKRTLSAKSGGYDHKADFFAMDTVVSVRSQSDITKDIENIFSEYQNVLDCNSEESEVYSLNHNGSITASDILSETVSGVQNLNSQYGSLTDITVGRLTTLWNVTGENPTVPEESEIKAALETVGTDNIVTDGNKITLKNNTALDFGAVGKGAVLDACLDYLDKNACKKTYISTGSSLLLYGSGSFHMSITSPDGGIIASVKTEQCFLSTSGGYERYFEADGKTYCHIIDPSTGYPTETDLTTVTVFSDSGIESDFLSTMIFLDGSENIEKYLHSDRYKIFAADKNKKLYVSDGLDYEVSDESYGK